MKPLNYYRGQAQRMLDLAFSDMTKAISQGDYDVAASKANFIGQDIDSIMRSLAQDIINSGGKKK